MKANSCEQRSAPASGTGAPDCDPVRQAPPPAGSVGLENTPGGGAWRTGTGEGACATTRFKLATEADDADIRWLLRENPMPGRISLSLEREPDYFADAHLPGTEKQTIIAPENGRVVCVGSCTTRLRYVNGQPRRVGYLGGLRLDASVAGRFDILRRGYRFFREVEGGHPPGLRFTSIASDNARALKFLERRLPGMPLYEPLCDFVTLLLPVPRPERQSPTRRVGVVPKRQAGLETGAPKPGQLLLSAHPTDQQLAPLWSDEELAALEPLGLSAPDCVFIGDGAEPEASAALWDQRSFKQTVIRGYSPWLKLVRPCFNFFAPLLGEARLPAVGEVLNHAFVSHLAVSPDQPALLVGLLERLMSRASHQNIERLTLGFAANDPRLATVRQRFRGREYHSRLYSVRWPDEPRLELESRVCCPEVALL
jgi:hypothetical protein